MIFTNGFANFHTELIKIIKSQRKLDVPEWLKNFSIFDCIPGCKWSGGRYTRDFYKKFDFNIIRELNDEKISVFPTFTNLVYTDLDDELLNKTLGVLSEYDGNGVIIANPILYNYLKGKFPKIKISASISGVGYTRKAVLDVLKKYDYVCLKQRSYFEGIPEEFKAKCEVLVDNSCSSNCPYYKKHYTMVSDAILHDYRASSQILNHLCFYKKETIIFDKSWFIEQGFTTFKFGMRSFPLGVQVSAIKHQLDDLNRFFLKCQ